MEKWGVGYNKRSFEVVMYNLWKNVLEEIKTKVSAPTFSTYFADSELITANGGEVVINTKNIFVQKQFEKKYDGLIREALKKNKIEVKNITYVVSAGSTKVRQKAREITGENIEENARGVVKKISEVAKERFDNKETPSGLNSRYTMENFVVGSNNDLAVSVAKAVIENPGKRYNPFFLYGGPGLGKTHLVEAIGNELLRRNPKMKVLYTPIDHFYSSFVNSIQNKKGAEFSQRFRKLDLLIIDDIQFIVGKEKSQEEFFHIFNDLYQLNKQIIITSDRLPNQIRTVDERLASRLSSAGTFDIQMPNFEDRCAILKAKAEWEGANIEFEAIEYIAENVKTNIRDLESEYSRVLAVADLKGVTPLQLINAGYSSAIGGGKSKSVSAKQVVEKVAKYYDLSVKEMCGKSRVSNIKTARQVAMYILSKELQMSTTKIAPEVGVKDHTTVMNGLKRIDTDIKLNFKLRDQIEEIKEKIYGN